MGNKRFERAGVERLRWTGAVGWQAQPLNRWETAQAASAS